MVKHLKTSVRFKWHHCHFTAEKKTHIKLYFNSPLLLTNCNDAKNIHTNENRFRLNASRKKKTCWINVTSHTLIRARMRFAVEIDPEYDPNDLCAAIDRFARGDLAFFFTFRILFLLILIIILHLHLPQRFVNNRLEKWEKSSIFFFSPNLFHWFELDRSEYFVWRKDRLIIFVTFSSDVLASMLLRLLNYSTSFLNFYIVKRKMSFTF